MKKEVRLREETLITKAIGEAIRRSLEAEVPLSPSEEGIIRFTPFEKSVSSALTEFMENKDRHGKANEFSNTEGLADQVLYKTKPLKVSECRYVGTAFNTFLIFEGEEALILIDQHAAHERINYEKLKDKYEKHLLTAQEFLTPVSIDVPTGIIDDLISNLPLLESMGFQVEHFGGSRFLINGAPPFIDYRESADAVMGFIETLSENYSAGTLEFIDEAIKQMACKRSVRATENLSREEVLALVLEWEKTRNPYSCPHGRPVAFSISKHNIEKQFKRLGF
jgi:DNA mismatch repair ATPase MutL